MIDSLLLARSDVLLPAQHALNAVSARFADRTRPRWRGAPSRRGRAAPEATAQRQCQEFVPHCIPAINQVGDDDHLCEPLAPLREHLGFLNRSVVAPAASQFSRSLCPGA